MRNIDFREALGSLSTFATDFKGDLNADHCHNELSKVFFIEKSGGESSILSLERMKTVQVQKSKMTETSLLRPEALLEQLLGLL